MALSLNRLPIAAKVGVGAGAVGLVAVAYAVVFYADISSKMDAEDRKRTQLKEELSRARKAEYSYQKDLAELSDRQQRQRELNKVLPVTSEYPAFLSSIQNVANVSGVALTAWSPLPEVTDKFYARVPMKLELSGRFHQVAKFFYGVGQLDRIINLENISLSDPKPVGEDVLLRVEGLATAFRALEVSEQRAAVDKRAAAKGKR